MALVFANPLRRYVVRRRTIAERQAALVARLPHVAPRRAHATCWACGYLRPGWLPTRAHIVPRRYGARPNQPRNYLLLCWPCHQEQPDDQPWPVQERWLLTHRPHPRARRAVEKQLSRRAHNAKIAGASPAGATNIETAA